MKFRLPFESAQALSLILLFTTTAALLAQDETRLAANGKALQPIVVAADASEKTRQSAAILADYLKRISGAQFEVQTGDGTTGIAVGISGSFPALGLQKEFDTNDPARREEYLLRSSPTGVLLVGAGEKAVQDAVWDFLHRLGYRQFFPGANWEIIPKEPNLQIAVNVKELPDYLARGIWFTYGTWPDNRVRMNAWSAKNRAISGVTLNTGHAYGGIISRNKAEFDAHPEYISSIDGEPKAPQTPREIQSVQFDISNPGLRQLVVDDALRAFAKDPELDSISVDPNDGASWGNSEAEQKVGSISDRVTLLANEVAAAVDKQYPGKYIGFYAYNKHSPPPSIRIHPNVVPSVATAFISGGFTVDQLMEGWQKQGATIGLREYFSVIAWDRDLPRGARSARMDYLTKTIPHYHKKGARFMSAESSDNWGPAGLGYYLAARMMWDVDEAKNVPALIEDFLDKSFGPAKEPMRAFYGLLNGIDNSPAAPLSEDFVGRMYRSLDAAYKKTSDPAIRARLDDLALYARYVELYRAYSGSRDGERQAAYETLISFVYGVRDTHMVHSLAMYRERFRDKSVETPAEATWKIAEKTKDGQPLNPWKQNPPVTPEEIQTLVSTGIAKNKLLDFEPRTFSSELVPADSLNLTPVARTEFAAWRNVQEFWVWAKAAGPIPFRATAGIIYKTRGPAKIQFFAAGEEGEGAVEGTKKEEQAAPVVPIPLAEIEVQPDAQETEFSFAAPRPGLYRIRAVDSAMGTSLRFSEGPPVVVRSALGAKPVFQNRWKLYFYVPKHTKSVGGFAHGGGLVRDADGTVVFKFPTRNEYFNIPVESGQDGRMWAFEGASGNINLMTVPPYLARSEKELLVPKEVVEADAK